MSRPRPFREDSASSGPVIRTLALLLFWLASVLPAAEDAAQLEQRLASAVGPARIEILLSLAEAHLYRAPDRVVSYAQQALDAANAAGRTHDAARALLTRSTGLFQLGDLDRALASYREGLTLAERLDDPTLRGGCLNGIGAIAMKRGDLDAALESLEAASAELTRAGNRQKLAGVNNNLSLIYYNQGRYDRALDFMFKALRDYEAIADERGQGVVLNAIGNVYNKLGDPERAREHFARSLAIAEHTGHTQLAVSARVNLGEILIRQKRWGEALAELERALALARELGNREYISICYNNMGDALREMGRPEEALRQYRESQALFEAMNARPRLAVSAINIGRIDLEAGRLAAAEAQLRRALDEARAVQELGLQRDAAAELVRLYERRGDFRQALDYQRLAAELREKAFSKENLEKLATLESRHEAEKKQDEIELLKRQREIQELEVRRQRLLLSLVVTSLALLSALALVLYRRYRLKVRTGAELALAYSRMSELAAHDELTGLYNRRSASERLEIEVARSGRTHRPFSIALVDVDDFKRINDERGHPCGDEVLRQLAQLLTASVRSQDLVSRWGGEEFLLILPETSRDGALALAEKLRQAVAAVRIADPAGELTVTVTLGVATYDRLGSLADCLRSADEALYAGKRAGKNRVVAAAA